MLRLPIVGALSLGQPYLPPFATRTQLTSWLREDQQFGQVRLLDASDAPLGNTPITVAVIPRRPDTWGAHPYCRDGSHRHDRPSARQDPCPRMTPAFSAPNGL
jgi:hypothetical protein